MGLRRARAATLFMLALPGSAYLYQGEELGLPEVADLPADALQDPIWLRTGHTQKGRDGCRVPLPWDADGDSLGFGVGRGWLPQPAGFAPLAVATQLADPDSTLQLYRRALRLRRELQTDEVLEWVATDSPDVLHFARPGGWHCVTNFGTEPVALPAGEVRVASGPVGGRPAPRGDHGLADPRLTPPFSRGQPASAGAWSGGRVRGRGAPRPRRGPGRSGPAATPARPRPRRPRR